MEAVSLPRRTHLTMTYSQDCIDLVKASEGCVLRAYLDSVGVPTIGFGHTGKEVHEGLQWTLAQAEAQLAADLQIHSEAVERSFPNRTFTQGQMDALTSLFFNIGAAKLKSIAPTFWRHVTNQNDAQVPFDLYHADADGTQHGLIYAGGKILPGLVIRRQKEIDLWRKQA